MPIRLKKGQQPKYRMIYATNHEDGCVLMNDNMYKRWEVLFTEVQNYGQMTLYQQDVENNIIDRQNIRDLLLKYLIEFRQFVRLHVFYAGIISDIGVKYNTADFTAQLFEENGIIEVRRDPPNTPTGMPSKSWTVGRGKSVELRYLK